MRILKSAEPMPHGVRMHKLMWLISFGFGIPCICTELVYIPEMTSLRTRVGKIALCKNNNGLCKPECCRQPN